MEKFNFHRPYTIPSLDEMLSPDTAIADCGPYNRSAFAEFLAYSHCMENLEFILELDKFLRRARDYLNDAVLMSDRSIRTHAQLQHQWGLIHHIFLTNDAIKEINVPCVIRNSFQPDVLPSKAEVLPIRGMVYELLLDSYNEFVSYTRESTNDCTTRRRRLELVPPEMSHAAPVPHDYGNSAPRLLSISCQEQKALDLRQQWDKALLDFELSKTEHSSPSSTSVEATVSLPRSRNGSAGTISTRPSSRGSSIGSIVDNLKDYSNKTIKKFRIRRASGDDPMSPSST